MREIKFRALSMCKGEHWLYGDLRHYNRNPHTEKWTIHDPNTGIETDIDETTVGQFTGCYDKNHSRIFEGDIVECVSWNEYFSKDGQPMEPFRRKMYVDFRKGGFKMVEPMPEPMKDNEWDIIFNGDIVIIGNIYDNPELIDMERLKL